MLDEDTQLPNVFVITITPLVDLPPQVVEGSLLARTATFALAPYAGLDPALFSHRILRAADGGYAWEIAFEGVYLAEALQSPADKVGEAVREEVCAALEGLGEIRSFAAYVDLSRPAPGPGFGRATVGAGGAVTFADDDRAGWECYAADSGEPEAGQKLPDDLLAEIEQNRAKVPVEPYLAAYKVGHMYAGLNDKPHLAYLNQALAAAAAKASAADKRKIFAFQAFQSREGSTAAINTYDNQIVTWGTGWGGLGALGKVMERAVANTAVRDALGAAGVRYRGKNVYDVVDLEQRSLVTGTREALLAMRRSIPLLYLLIDVARGEHTRDAATLAQLLTFMASSGNVTGAEAVASQALFNLIAHLRHWAPGYAAGCLEWAAPQVSDAPVSEDRDRRLAVLVGRYFYGQAHKYTWIPDFRQFKLYWKHMKTDGLDCMEDPFILAAEAPTEDPFASVPISRCAAVAAPAVVAAVLKNAPLAGQAELDSVAGGKGVISRGAKGEGVKALQQAVMALGVEVPGGADGAFGPGFEGAVKAIQGKLGLSTDGVVGAGTLKALDARLGERAAKE